MSDIEKTTIQARLRAVWDGSSSYDMCHEAADELDRLRAERPRHQSRSRERRRRLHGSARSGGSHHRAVATAGSGMSMATDPTKRDRFWLFLSTCAIWVASRLLPGKGWVINVERKP